MNPLDKLEFQSFNDRINDEMPLHTSVDAKIPSSFVRGLPKNLMEYSSEVDNRFLNKYQHTIEELNQRSPNNIFVRNFIQYQKEYYEKFGILKGDNIFNRVIKTRRAGGPILGQFILFGNTHVNGSPLEGGDTSNNSVGWGVNIRCTKLATGTVGEFYDEVAINALTSAVAVSRLGAYDDSGGQPNNLQIDVGSVTILSGFNYFTGTEFALNTTQMFAAFFPSTAAAAISLYYQTTAESINYKSQAFSVLPDPFPTPTGTLTDRINMKIGHS